MKTALKKIWKYSKAVVIPVVAAAVPIAAAGTFGPKAQAVAAALVAVWGVFSKRPQDDNPQPPAESVDTTDLMTMTLQQRAAKNRQ